MNRFVVAHSGNNFDALNEQNMVSALLFLEQNEKGCKTEAVKQIKDYSEPIMQDVKQASSEVEKMYSAVKNGRL
jgi:hypothetical protein